jgi:hypothetical protein
VVSRAGERAWRLALAALLLGGGAIVAWLAVRSDGSIAAPDPPGVTWEAIAPDPAAGLRPWRWIVLHHSGARRGDATSIDHEHQRGRGWEGIGYHFVIGNGQPMARGRIEATFRWRGQREGAHAGGDDAQRPYNQEGIGVCVIGDYRGGALDRRVEERLAALCALLIGRCPGLSPERIIGHREVPGKRTACPGDIDLARLRALVAERLRALVAERPRPSASDHPAGR